MFYINLYIYLIDYKSHTPGLRFKLNIKKFKFFNFFKKFFFFRKKNNAGRGNSGQILVRHRGSKLKKNFHISLNYNRRWSKQLNILIQIQKHSSFNFFIGLVKYSNGSYSYINLQHGCFIGQVFQSIYLPLRFLSFSGPGNIVPLKFLNQQSVFSNISTFNEYKSKYCRSGGTYCRIWQKQSDLGIVTIILPTKKKKHFLEDTFVVLGRNSNIFNSYQILGKAGEKRKKGFRSCVRGVAMNPVDHPHGGRTKSNSPELSAWGWVAKKNN